MLFLFHRDSSERKIMLLSDFNNKDKDIVEKFRVDEIASRLSSENIFLIAMYVYIVCIFYNHQNDNNWEIK